jgi:hypothetical protein
LHQLVMYSISSDLESVANVGSEADLNKGPARC